MIKAIGTSFNNVSFGNYEEHDERKIAAEVAAGTGGAALAIKGSDTFVKVAEAAKQGKQVLADTAVKAGRFEKFFIGIFESAGKSRFLKYFAEIAKSGPAKAVAGALGGVLAVATCITDTANMVNVTSKLAEAKSN